MILSLRYCQVFLLRFWCLISFKGFLIWPIYLRDDSTPTWHHSTRTFFESYRNSSLRICHSQVVEATANPYPKGQGTSGLESMSFWAFLTSGLFRALHFFFFPSFFWAYLHFIHFLPGIFQHPQEGRLLKHHGSLACG